MTTALGKSLMPYHSTASTNSANDVEFRYRITETATQYKTHSILSATESPTWNAM